MVCWVAGKTSVLRSDIAGYHHRVIDSAEGEVPFSSNRRTCDHIINKNFNCLKLSEDNMCTTHRLSLMTARHHRLEMTACFRGFINPSVSWCLLAGDPVKGNQRPPRKKNPPALIQLSPALHSELKTLQKKMATRGSGALKAEWHRVCQAAYKAISSVANLAADI